MRSSPGTTCHPEKKSWEATWQKESFVGGVTDFQRLSGLQILRLNSGHFTKLLNVGLRALHLTPADGNHLGTWYVEKCFVFFQTMHQWHAQQASKHSLRWLTITANRKQDSCEFKSKFKAVLIFRRSNYVKANISPLLAPPCVYNQKYRRPDPVEELQLSGEILPASLWATTTPSSFSAVVNR